MTNKEQIFMLQIGIALGKEMNDNDSYPEDFNAANKLLKDKFGIIVGNNERIADVRDKVFAQIVSDRSNEEAYIDAYNRAMKMF